VPTSSVKSFQTPPQFSLVIMTYHCPSQKSEMSCICVRFICASQDSEMSCICVLWVYVPSRDSEMSCISVLGDQVKTVRCHVFVC
jgi:hypothetical protein